MTGIGDARPRRPAVDQTRLVVRPPTLSEAALQQLREDLIQGRYERGDPIRVDQVAAEFGMSAVPVREALRVLLAEGRVQYAAHRGYRVTELTGQDVEEIFLMCALLEAEAVRRGVAAIDDAGIKRMQTLLGRLESPPRSASVWDVAAIHQEFHFVPITFAKLPRVEAELRRLWDHTDHYRSLYLFGDPTAVDRMKTEHREIATAVAGRDAEFAVALGNAHREHALRHARHQATQQPEPSGPSGRPNSMISAPAEGVAT